MWMSSTWLTTKLDRLRPRTVGTGAKELVSNSDKSSTSSSSSGKKRKEKKRKWNRGWQYETNPK